eukprot:TRINITY_DN5225_c0_g1_i1.p2 TRINITY_DN5225_c0_g1~~TRINITY_DN5225_c0_g1_i1.p2  ORF type:complete len:144 (+),score=27.62 TRINITY_DN5225_c0_g1_i1:488-919(+)
MLCDRMNAISGTSYGDMPVHTGLWDIVNDTRNDPCARVAGIQLVQEGRALDSQDRLLNKFRSYGDTESCQMIEQICKEEIPHVRMGVTWFKYICKLINRDPIDLFHEYVQKYQWGIVPPFNHEYRKLAGLDKEWYVPVAFIRK